MRDGLIENDYVNTDIHRSRVTAKV